MSQYSALEPTDKNFLEPEEILRVIIQNFKHYLLDEETAKKEMAQRIEFLKEMNMPEQMIEMYEKSKPIRCTIYNDDKSSYLSFDLNNNEGILILPDCDIINGSGLEDTVKILAAKTGYELTMEEE